ncbi:MAG: hypothetical protein NDI90_16015 [Nitrospira sp. BO4]|jgi:hypothetical protein|nr:hypothetical protein [Nitrospira sp. BO4]
MGGLDEAWDEVLLRVAKSDLPHFRPGNVTVGYIYTNWRGKTFLVDEEHARRFQDALRKDDCDESFIRAQTPERIIRDLPMMEEERRIEQLEENVGMASGSERPSRMTISAFT